MKEKINNTAIAVSASLAGFCNALLGAGGGILLSFALSVFRNNRTADKRYILINSQAAMIPGCLISCLIYAVSGSFSPIGFVPFSLSAVIGGVLGALLLPKISAGRIGIIFAIFVIWSGIRMVIG